MGLVLVLLLLLSPIAYVEIMCRGDAEPEQYAALLPEAYHRPETRTFMTYPEWHIVHAYEDYAQVIAKGDPHEFGYVSSIKGFWSSLCSLAKKAPAHGEIDGSTKSMVYTIGVSFTAELLLKAAYEETIGRLFASLRGDTRTPLDDLSAHQARAYAAFLQQVPWYKWPFRVDVAALNGSASQALRDTERKVALGLEYRAKAAYAGAIEQAVASTGVDQLTLQMIVAGSDINALAAYDGVTVVGKSEAGVIIETPRYRALTHLLAEMAVDGFDFVEIAGNDDILFTVLSDKPVQVDAFFNFRRQGFSDYRHLVLLKVSDLAVRLRTLYGSPLTLEHIHDY